MAGECCVHGFCGEDVLTGVGFEKHYISKFVFVLVSEWHCVKQQLICVVIWGVGKTKSPQMETFRNGALG